MAAIRTLGAAFEGAPISRRAFVGLLAASLAGCREEERAIPGRIVGGSAEIGHLLRQGGLPPPAYVEERAVVIIGGGVAGLTAARHLAHCGVKDLLLLELESESGGTARSGQNRVSAYPWAAHYVPLANPESRDLRDLFMDLGVITGHEGEAPVYADEMLCGDPHERLFQHGRWHEGLVLRQGLTAEDHAQWTAFHETTERLRVTVGADGARLFAIPLDLSSADPQWRALDQLTMAQWLDQQGLTSPALRWYVDYGCRDDFGAGIDHVSAWAGLHYYCARTGVAANATRETVITWPEGNGWLVQRLAEPLSQTGLRTGCLVFRMQNEGEHVLVDYYDLAQRQTVRMRARAAICATPRFVAERLAPELPRLAPQLHYAPWMVANITLEGFPLEAFDDAPLSWDNVPYGSQSLGYVVATHQALRSHPRNTVLTHYWPLDHLPPAQARQEALGKSHAAWCEQILADLEAMHPGLHRQVRNIDVYVWGHGMICPTPGTLWGERRSQMQAPLGRIHFAHSDLSGMALFEEAHAQGMRAGRAVQALLAT